MPAPPKRLEASYRALAVPAGSPRYWSWLFAAPPMREPLLGIYALLAEWRDLIDPAVELAAAHGKLAWWREEIERLGRGAPVHPISRYIASLPHAGPRAGELDFMPLENTLEAAARQIGGAPLERGAELEAHAAALWAVPLATAARLAGRPEPALAEAVRRAEAALAAAEYLNDAIAGYRRAARFGRVVFPVDELLAANIEDADLCAAEPPLHLQSYLEELRGRAARYYSQASAVLPTSEHEPMRHLLVLAALGERQVSERGDARGDGRLGDARRNGLLPLRELYLAWSTARRAVRRQ
jgi:phytoene synthase